MNKIQDHIVTECRAGVPQNSEAYSPQTFSGGRGVNDTFTGV